MRAAIAKDAAHHVGAAVYDLRLLGVVVRAIHEADELDDA
jgi:hypothetical protein